jgi:hypothetical protein
VDKRGRVWDKKGKKIFLWTDMQRMLKGIDQREVLLKSNGTLLVEQL